jgi:hypothetical protein
LLNSRLLNLYLKQISTNFHGGYIAANKQYVEQLPIKTINFFNESEKARHEQIVKYVETLLNLNQHKAESKSQHDKELMQRQINSTAREIDQLVYELYGLTEEEINIVEAGTSK